MTTARWSPGSARRWWACSRLTPEADWVTGHVGAGDRDASDLPVVTTFPVTDERTRRGPLDPPG